MLNKFQKSFTLIELLVVIAIVGLIAAIIMVNISGAQAKARDAKRQAELDQVRKALEFYYTSEGKYPTQDSGYCCIEAKSGEECQCDSFAGDIASYLPTVPEDPLCNPTQPCGEDKYGYQYKTENEGETYELYAKREQGGFFEISSELGTIAYSPEGPGGPPVWLLGYSYRKLVTLNSSTGAGTNYQVKLKISKTSAASGEDFDLNGYVLDSFNDIRFTDNDKTTLLDYWIEKVEDSNGTKLATVWVEVADDLSSAPVDIYIYYGNPSASSTSNSSAVFGKSVSIVYGRDSYYVALILSTREWITGGTGLGISGDDSGASRTMPASRIIYGTSVSTVYLSTNGLLRWDNVADTVYSNSLNTTKKVLTAHWDDLYINTTSRSDAGLYEITGSDVLGSYIAYRWAVTHCCGATGPSDFETLLYATNYIQFNFSQLYASDTPNEYISRGDSTNYIDLTPRWLNMESVLFVPRVSPEPSFSLAGNEESL